eukprot:gene9978-11001_t
MAPSLVEVDFRRLLGKCESMVAKAQQSDGKFEWRIEKYLEALRFQLQDIGKQSSKPDQEVLREYKRKVDFLQGVIQTEKIQCSSSKLRAYQQLIPASSNLHSDHCSNSQHVSDLSKDIHLLSRGRYHKEMRNELFGLEDENLDGGLKRRRGVSTEDHSTKEDIDEIIRQHHEKQEKVAEEMIKMAQNMKHTSLAASNIIKADKDVRFCNDMPFIQFTLPKGCKYLADTQLTLTVSNSKRKCKFSPCVFELSKEMLF